MHGSTNSAYRDLEARFRRLSLLGEAAGFLGWDHATLMPEGGAESRAEQLAALQVVCHEIITEPAVEDLMAEAEQSGGLDPWQRANLREMRRRWVHAGAVSADLVEARARADAACEMAWRRARPDSDFASVEPLLEQVLCLTVEAGQAKAARLGTSVYDALLDEYEPDGRAADIDPVFDDYAAFLPGFLDDVLARQAAEPATPLPGGPYPEDLQRDVGVRFMETLGFDFHHGRLDVSLHPFCAGTPDDLRITTRYDEADFVSALMGVLHETGHALYEKQLPKDWRHQPVGEARGMAIHESQSLLIEMQVCRSPEFLAFAAPILREAFASVADTAAPAWEADNLYRLYTRVERSLIRVDADEVTYPAHVILRYRLERAMIAGDLKVADLPGAWNDGLEALLGIAPPDDRLGCLQDIHWYGGSWGYFPTYTLGAMAAAQFFDAAKRSGPGVVPAIARGDFKPLMAWLAANVHGKASFLSAQDLLTEATGRPLDPKVFEAHLRARYLG